MSHQLRVLAGPAAGQVLPISAGYLYSIGRGAEAQLSIPADQTLSRSHAEIYFDQTNNAWLLKNKSQHGTLLNGEVFQDHRYVQPGTSFQVGGSTINFELAGAAAPAAAAPAAAGGFGAPAAGGFGAPAGGAPAADGGFGGGAPTGGDPYGGQGAIGGPVGGAPAGAEGPGAGAKAGAAFGAAAGALGGLTAGGGSPVRIEHSGDGYPYKDLILGGLSLVKANLVPSLALFGPTVALFILGIVIMSVVSPGIGGLVMLLGQLTMLSLWITLPNYLLGLKKFQETGEAMSIGTLLDFSNIPHKIKSVICSAAGNMVLGLGSYAFYAQLEHPEAGLVDCIKLGYKYGLKNLVPMIIMGIVIGIVVQISFIALGVGGVVGVPVGICAHYLGYTIKRAEFESFAASEGIALP